MCRFVAYIGPSILADDLLYKPKFSLVTAQTMNAGEMSVSVNGDGFGIGFYAPSLTTNHVFSAVSVQLGAMGI